MGMSVVNLSMGATAICFGSADEIKSRLGCFGSLAHAKP